MKKTTKAAEAPPISTPTLAPPVILGGPPVQCILACSAEDMDVLNAALVALKNQYDRTVASLQAQVQRQLPRP